MDGWSLIQEMPPFLAVRPTTARYRDPYPSVGVQLPSVAQQTAPARCVFLYESRLLGPTYESSSSQSLDSAPLVIDRNHERRKTDAIPRGTAVKTLHQASHGSGQRTSPRFLYRIMALVLFGQTEILPSGLSPTHVMGSNNPLWHPDYGTTQRPGSQPDQTESSGQVRARSGADEMILRVSIRRCRIRHDSPRTIESAIWDSELQCVIPPDPR